MLDIVLAAEYSPREPFHSTVAVDVVLVVPEEELEPGQAEAAGQRGQMDLLLQQLEQYLVLPIAIAVVVGEELEQ